MNFRFGITSRVAFSSLLFALHFHISLSLFLSLSLSLSLSLTHSLFIYLFINLSFPLPFIFHIFYYLVLISPPIDEIYIYWLLETEVTISPSIWIIWIKKHWNFYVLRFADSRTEPLNALIWWLTLSCLITRFQISNSPTSAVSLFIIFRRNRVWC